VCAGSILGHGGRRQSLMTGVAVGVDVFACLVTLLAVSSATSEVEALFMTAGPVLFGAGFDFNFWILVGLQASPKRR